MTGPGRIMTSTRIRIVLSVLGIVVVAALVLASTHNSKAPASSTTATTSVLPVQVPQLVGLPLAAAETLLQSDGLTVSVTTVASGGAAGTVLSQSPSAGSNVKSGSKVSLTAAAGNALPVIPNVAGQTVNQAKATLKALGFTVKSQTREHSSVTAGDVISTNPPAGTSVPANASVQLIVSQGPVKVKTTTKKPTVFKPPATTRPPSPPTTRPTSPPTTEPPTTEPPTTEPPTTEPTTTVPGP